jgi:peptide/nickel transport system permease protein
MRTFVIRRAALAVLLLFISSIIVFYGMRAAPGDVTKQLVNPAVASSPSVVANLREHLGLDKPLIAQYGNFMKNVLTGDPGISLVNGSPIGAILGRTALQSLKLALAAALLTYLIAIPLGLLAAWRRNSLIDHGSMALAVLGMGIPNFFLAVLLIQLFAVTLHWLPVAGSEGFTSIILPAAVLAAEAIAINLRMVRSSVLEELGKDYVRTLRATGVSEWRVVAVHALRNALPPIFALAGVMMRSLLAYTMIVEVIFRWPGLGYQLVQSIQTRDYTLAQVLALLVTACVVLFNFLADVGQRWADPRVRAQA